MCRSGGGGGGGYVSNPYQGDVLLCVSGMCVMTVVCVCGGVGGEY